MDKRNWALLLLLIPFIALLWPPFYAHIQPAWLGVPMFIWYQFLWTILGAGVTGAVYFIQRRAERE